MQPLADILLAPPRKRAVVADLAQLIEDQIATIRGLRGMSLKAGLAMLKRAAPDVLPRAVGRFLPEFVETMEPLYRRHRESDSGDFGAFLRTHADEATGAMLSRADQRMHVSSNATARGYWQKFRGLAQDEVRRAVPALGEILDRHLRTGAQDLTAHQP
jgi:hypothetical protein